MKNKNTTQQLFGTLFLLMICFSFTATYAQVDAPDEEFGGFSGVLVPAIRTTRGESPNFDDVTPLSRGLIKPVEIKTQYQKIYLGADFSEMVFKEKSCTKVKTMITSNKKDYVPVCGGDQFKHLVINQLADITGYYQFKNNNYFPGLQPNAVLFVKMEAHQFGKSTEANCMTIKFLMPEMVENNVSENTYYLRNDGALIAQKKTKEGDDFTKSSEFAKYLVFPLKDMNDETHLVGKDFHVLGTFASQENCEPIHGLLFPTSRKGVATGCIFFRKLKDVPEKFQSSIANPTKVQPQ